MNRPVRKIVVDTSETVAATPADTHGPSRQVRTMTVMAFVRLHRLAIAPGDLQAHGDACMELCRQNNWDFMIVFQDDSLPSVWEEIEGLKSQWSGLEIENPSFGALKAAPSRDS